MKKLVYRSKNRIVLLVILLAKYAGAKVLKIIKRVAIFLALPSSAKATDGQAIRCNLLARISPKGFPLLSLTRCIMREEQLSLINLSVPQLN